MTKISGRFIFLVFLIMTLFSFSGCSTLLRHTHGWWSQDSSTFQEPILSEKSRWQGICPSL